MEPEKLELLREALPYIRRFKGKTLVVKMSGWVTEEPSRMQSLAEEIALCHQVGFRMVVVHGGGKQLTEMAGRLGVPQSVVNGRRITDHATLDLAKMVFAGKINTDILAALRRLGVRVTGLSGLDGNIVRAKRREIQSVLNHDTGEREMVDYGHVGDVLEIDGSLLELLLSQGYLPVISSLGADDEGNVFNINADTIASEVAAHLKAEKLILLSNVDGVYRDPSDPASKLSRLSLQEVQRLLDNNGVGGGMLPKLHSIASLLKRGVRSAHIIDGTRRNALLEEIFTDQGGGTMIWS